MTTLDNLLAVVTNIYGINIVTRNKMKGAIQRKELGKLHDLINNNEYENHIPPEVQVVLSTMLKNTKPEA